MPEGSLAVAAPTDTVDDLRRARRLFKVARAVFGVSALVFLFVLTSGVPHRPSPTVASSPDGAATTVAAGTGSTTAAGAGSTVAGGPATASTGAPLTWDDLGSLPLGTPEDVLRERATVCAVASDKQVGDHTERAYSCEGARPGSALRVVVIGGKIAQRSTSDLRGEREAATMTPDLFAKLSKGMTEEAALAITGPCDLGVDQLVNAKRVASWTCYGPGNGFAVMVIQNGVVEQLIDHLTP
jgi:hypothetical protein